jgi:oxalate decarboxylase/phosphoglucose isomerase-like protein (cupin superfamily)
VKPGTPIEELMGLKFHTFSMCIVISGKGTFHLQEFSSEEKLNQFTVEANCAYYLMPNQDFMVSNDSESDLVMFIAKPDI